MPGRPPAKALTTVKARIERENFLPAVEVAGSEGDSAEYFASFGAANGEEMAQIAVAGGQGGVAYAIGDLHQLVGIGSRIAIGADRRSDGEDGHGSVEVMASDDVAAAAPGNP